jgi:hypothetical protein
VNETDDTLLRIKAVAPKYTRNYTSILAYYILAVKEMSSSLKNVFETVNIK